MGRGKEHQERIQLQPIPSDEAERETLRRLLLAIKTEIATTWETYESEVGRHVNSLDYYPVQLLVV